LIEGIWKEKKEVVKMRRGEWVRGEVGGEWRW